MLIVDEISSLVNSTFPARRSDGLVGRRLGPADGTPGVGLSLSHISPQGVVETPPQIAYAANASYVKLFRGGEYLGGGKRGPISGRSAQSRRRLLDTLHSVNKDAYFAALFLTLTYPDDIEPQPEKVHRDLDCLAERLRRRFPGMSAVWSQEPKARKSGAHVGKVYFHYHLIVFGVERVDKDWLSKVWFDVVGSGNSAHLRAGTQVQRLVSMKEGIGYVAKYLSKEQLDELEAAGFDRTGRTWGVFGRENLPVSIVYALVTIQEFFNLRRQLRNYVKGQARSRGRKVRYRSDETSGVTAYVSDETALRLLLSK